MGRDAGPGAQRAGTQRSWVRSEAPQIMSRRSKAPQPPAGVCELSESRSETSARPAAANGRAPRRLPDCRWRDGWGWYDGELVCPLSWLLAMDRSHHQHPEDQSDED